MIENKTQTMTFSTNYSVVDVNDELPENSGWHRTDVGEIWFIKGVAKWMNKEPGSHSQIPVQVIELTHWLKPVANSIIFTKEELEARDRRVAAEAWDAGFWKSTGSPRFDDRDNTVFPPNKETYLNSLINK